MHLHWSVFPRSLKLQLTEDGAWSSTSDSSFCTMSPLDHHLQLASLGLQQVAGLHSLPLWWPEQEWKNWFRKHREKYWVFLDLLGMNNIFPAGWKIRVLIEFEKKKKCLIGKLSAFCWVTTSLLCYRANSIFVLSEHKELSGSPCLKFPLANPHVFGIVFSAC